MVVSPVGGVLSGNGVVGMQFNPSIAGEGYHNLTYTYGTGTCVQDVDYLTFVSPQLISYSY